MKTIKFDIPESFNGKSIKAFFQYAHLSSKNIHLLKMAKAVQVNQRLANDTYIFKKTTS